MSVLPSIKNAFIRIEGNEIVEFGVMKNLKSNPKVEIRNPNSIMDTKGGFVLPAWCDSHTHIVFSGSRENEFLDKIKGLTYEEIAQKGGGILNSAILLNETSEEQLFDQSWKRLEEVKALGTGAIEIKSGYGLTVEGELKMLRVIKKFKEKSDLLIKSTFLVHTYPIEYRTDHQAYINLIINDLLPIIATLIGQLNMAGLFSLIFMAIQSLNSMPMLTPIHFHGSRPRCGYQIQIPK